MKVVKLIKTTHIVNGIEGELDYRDQFMMLVSSNTNGFTYDEMRKVDKVYDKLEAAKGQDSVELEDAEHEVLKKRLENPGFVIYTKGLFKMCESGIEAEKVEE